MISLPAICPHLACLLQGVLADVSIATGWMTIGLMLTGRFVFQYLGWGFAAAATPAVMLLSGAAFFGFSLASQFPSWNLSLGGMNLAAAGATAGAVTQVWGCVPAGSHGCMPASVHHAEESLCAASICNPCCAACGMPVVTAISVWLAVAMYGSPCPPSHIVFISSCREVPFCKPPRCCL